MKNISFMKPIVLLKSLEDMHGEQKERAVRLLNNKEFLIADENGAKFVSESEARKRKIYFYGSEAVCIYRQMLGLPVTGISYIDVNKILQSVTDYFCLYDILYFIQRVEARNNRFNKVCEMAAPTVILFNEHRMLRECVEYLQDNRWNQHPFIYSYDIEDEDGNNKYCEDVRQSLIDIGYDLVTGDCGKKCRGEN